MTPLTHSLPNSWIPDTRECSGTAIADHVVFFRNRDMLCHISAVDEDHEDAPDTPPSVHDSEDPSEDADEDEDFDAYVEVCFSLRKLTLGFR